MRLRCIACTKVEVDMLEYMLVTSAAEPTRPLMSTNTPAKNTETDWVCCGGHLSYKEQPSRPHTVLCTVTIRTIQILCFVDVVSTAEPTRKRRLLSFGTAHALK